MNINLLKKQPESKIYEYEFIPYKKLGPFILDKNMSQKDFKKQTIPYFTEISPNLVYCKAVVLNNPVYIKINTERNRKFDSDYDKVYIIYNNVKIRITSNYNIVLNDFFKICDDLTIIDRENVIGNKLHKNKITYSKSLGIMMESNMYEDDEYYIDFIAFEGKESFETSMLSISDMIMKSGGKLKPVREYSIECKEIIKGILSKLTSDLEENKKYLMSQMVLYKNHRYSKQILDAITKTLYNNFNLNDNYSGVLSINGIDVPYVNSAINNEMIYANSDKLFLAEIESSVNKYLNIKEFNTKIVLDVKNLYRIILTCGEFEHPFVDENVLGNYLKNKEQVIRLIKKFPSLNLNYFNNTLNYLTFDLNDYSYVYHLISILSDSFINISNDPLKSEDIMNDDFKYKLGMCLDENLLNQLTRDNFKEVNILDFGLNNKSYSNGFLQLSFSGDFLNNTLPELDAITILEKNNINSFYTIKINDNKYNTKKKLLSYGFIADKDLDFEFVKESIKVTIYSEDERIIQISLSEQYIEKK